MLFMQAAYIFAEAVSSPAALPSLPAAEPCSGQQDHAFGRSFLDGTSVWLEVMEVRVRRALKVPSDPNRSLIL